MKQFRDLIGSENGNSTLEYGVMLGVGVAVLLVGATMFSRAVDVSFDNAARQLQKQRSEQSAKSSTSAANRASKIGQRTYSTN